MGSSVRNLPFFRYSCVRFSISAKTPSQFDPNSNAPSLTERQGADHIHLTSLGIHSKTEEPKPKDLKTMFSEEFKALLADSNVITKSNIQAAQALLKFADELEGKFPDKDTKYRHQKKSKKSYAHFYYGMGEEHQKLLQKAAATAEARARRKGDASLDGNIYGDSRDNRPEAKLYRAHRDYKDAAISLQKIWRNSMHKRVVKFVKRRQWAAMSIQRCFRGYRTKLFVKAFKSIRIKSAIVAERLWRGYCGRKYFKWFFNTRTAASITIQRYTRGMLARRLIQFEQRHYKKICLIQKMIRGYLARVYFRRRLAAKYFEEVVLPAAVNIQRSYRGYMDRKIYKKLAHERWIRDVQIPSTIRIQSVWRMKLARNLRQYLRREKKAVLDIQRIFRGWQRRNEYMDMLLAKEQLRCALVIQGAYRTHIANKIVDKKRAERYYKTVVLASACKIQSSYRKHRAVLHFKRLIRQSRAALKIQSLWKGLTARRLYRKRWLMARLKLKNTMAARIQSVIRGFITRCHFRKLRREYKARVQHAVLLIQKVYRSFKKRDETRRFKEFVEIEKSNDILWECEDDINEILEDIKLAKRDKADREKVIRRAKRRINALKAERLEMELRLPIVEKEIEDLEPHDIETGWDVAYIEEWEFLTNTLEMTQMEIESRGYQIRDCEMESESITFELEELENDLEDAEVAYIDEMEVFRNRQIERGEKMLARKRAAAIRKQKNRWKIKSIRTNVIARNTRRQDFVTQAKGQLSLSDIMTLSFDKKKDRETTELTIEHALKDHDAARKASQVNENGYKNKAVHALYDEVEADVSDLLKKFTRPYRHPVSDYRAPPSKMCKKCGCMHCSCEEEEEGGALKKEEGVTHGYW